ncbi:MAG: D-alanyl-D-alanine carboxypeptidase [Oscillospiraceae bacterium]|nr:D-alanyl-D-alanine carboxypeptidase [Oscillospiraceae bacterium]
MMKRLGSGLLALLLLFGFSTDGYAVPATGTEGLVVEVPFAILMEKETGTVLFEQDADTQTAPASITKIMTTLLIMEEIEAGRLSLDDMIVTSARAASMGGSQIFLEEGEQMTVRDMLKGIVVSSANDASVAMAEHISGTEAAFAARMNQRAGELGMVNTTFVNSTGLPQDDGENQVTARDVALMSRALILHELVKEFSTIWMDSVRGGEFGLSNTNRLIYYYEGATGLKTGFTQTAMYCLAATAMRDGVEFIAVVLHGETSDQRFETAKTLLNFGFANYTLVDVQPADVLRPLRVELGVVSSVQPVLDGHPRLLLEKTKASGVTQHVELAETVEAPVTAGQTLGTLTVYDGETVIATIPIVAADSVERLTTGGVFVRFLQVLFTGGL